MGLRMLTRASAAHSCTRCTDTGGTAACVDLGDRRAIAEDFVQITDRADIGIAGMVRRTRQDRSPMVLSFCRTTRLRVGEQDGVAVRLRHLAPSVPGSLAAGVKTRVRENVRAPAHKNMLKRRADFAGQLDVRNLITPTRQIAKLALRCCSWLAAGSNLALHHVHPIARAAASIHLSR